MDGAEYGCAYGSEAEDPEAADAGGSDAVGAELAVVGYSGPDGGVPQVVSGVVSDVTPDAVCDDSSEVERAEDPLASG